MNVLRRDLHPATFKSFFCKLALCVDAGCSMGWLHGTLHVQILEARDLPMDDNLGIDLASKVPGQSKFGSAFGSVLRSAERAAGEGIPPANRSRCR